MFKQANFTLLGNEYPSESWPAGVWGPNEPSDDVDRLCIVADASADDAWSLASCTMTAGFVCEAVACVKGKQLKYCARYC